MSHALLARLDAAFNAVYTWRYNPLYYTGQLVIAAFVALLVTGLYLLLFYRIGAPYESVARITQQVWAGRWIRSLHRYASAAVVVAGVLHAIRYFAQDRSWGPRALAWISGIILFALFYLCGWTGYVMVWDVQAQLFAAEGARLFDFLPIFSEPIGRTFVGERDMPAAFFFLNLFAHIAVPVGIALGLWIHLSRLARSYLLPPRPLLWGATLLLVAVSVAWPMGMTPKADLLHLPSATPFDVLYGFWLPVTRALPAGSVWVGVLAGFGILIMIPSLVRPQPGTGPQPAVVTERMCTGCEQCYIDCPYEAISMEPRTDGREGVVAVVEAAKCTACAICAGSCAPMCIGIPDVGGRDQLAHAREFLTRHAPGPEDVVVIACERGAGGIGRGDGSPETPVLPVPCSGSLHTSVVEVLLRGGAGGVLVVSCRPGDCWNREGVKWLDERVHHGREAELQERVDRSRVRVGHAGAAERGHVLALIEEFRSEIRSR
ncbi:MAG: hydrogenase iron-sulfur subunit [Gemmatimonadota bacterium]|nr:hydrogenase iron-sulfur subunit [Gemmatimonadota bacterium]MDH5758549.1 hydrogenase iron-sulfur subunit [Gemmatimonadota bacterium]